MAVGLRETLTLPRGPSWANRIALAPLTTKQSNDDGTLGDDDYAFLTRRADGGFGFVMTCAAPVQSSGICFPGQLAAYSDVHIEGLARLADGVRTRGAVSAVQLQHGGARSDATISGEQSVGPVADPNRGVREMTTAEVEHVIEDFITAAVRCEKAGADGVELHGAHGYLLCQFLSAEENHRSDGFGGSYRNRTRIFRDIITGIRAATGPNFQLGVRLSPERYGCRTSEMLELSEELLCGGQVDYLDLSLWRYFKLPEETGFHPARLIDLLGRLRRSGDARLGVAGHILSSNDAQECLNCGADFVLLGRSAILQHDMGRRVATEPDFVSRNFPVSRTYLADQSIGPAFQEYLATGWPDYVSD